MIKSWVRLASDPRSSSEKLAQAAYWESVNCPRDYRIRSIVARNPATKGDLLAGLSLVKNLSVLIGVAGHRNLTEATAGDLLKSHLRALRISLAANPNIPYYAMKRLARDYEDVREALASNPKLTEDLMKRLVTEKAPKIRMALAKNPNIPLGCFRFLTKDSVTLVRRALLDNPCLPYEILELIAQDSDPEVKKACWKRCQSEFPEPHLLQTLMTGASNELVEEIQQFLRSQETEEAATFSDSEESEP